MNHLDPGEMPAEVREHVIEILAEALLTHARQHPERHGLAKDGNELEAAVAKAQASGQGAPR
jgi:hypothetical protein